MGGSRRGSLPSLNRNLVHDPRTEVKHTHMAKFINRLDFLLHITDYFHGHWEDPTWGRRPENQVLIHLAIAELANQVADVELKKAIQSATKRGVAVAGQAVAKGG